MSSATAAFAGALDVSPIAGIIDRAVQEFADQMGLDSVLRPHDQHVWYVRKRVEGAFFQQVQVAAFERRGDGMAIF